MEVAFIPAVERVDAILVFASMGTLLVAMIAFILYRFVFPVVHRGNVYSDVDVLRTDVVTIRHVR